MRSKKTHHVIRDVQKAKLNRETWFKVYREWVPKELPDELLDWPELESLELQHYEGPLAGLARLKSLKRVLPADVREGPWCPPVPSLAHWSGPGETRWREEVSQQKRWRRCAGACSSGG